MIQRIEEDINTVFAEDPAARSFTEVILCYPGLHAIWLHRIAHLFWQNDLKLIARIISHINRMLTNVEIHPGAIIGRRFFIDHGANIVIGETTEIGDDVLMYQGVTLGGTSAEKRKRHPTIGDRVEIGAGSIVLGPIVIGNGARIAAGSVVVKDVPAGATVIGVPGRIGLGFSMKEIAKLEHGKIPDPISDALQFLVKEQERLRNKIEKLESSTKKPKKQ